MAPTLEQIARLAGVAKSTASLALRDHPAAQRLSDATRARIRQAAEELDYHPNFFAAQLSSPQRKLLMFGLSQLGDSWASRIAHGFEKQASSHGFRVLVTAFQEKEDPVAFSREVLGVRGIPALAVVGGSATRFTDQAICQLAEEGVKIVTVNRSVGHPLISEVLLDNEQGAAAAAAHLYDLGIEKLWVVSCRSPRGMAQFTARMDGVLAEARRRGKRPPTQVLFSEIDDYLMRAREATEAALAHDRPQAIFATGDILAVGVCEALRAAGLGIGTEIPVVGFDGGVYSQAHYPKLTSVAQPTLAMGQAAAQILIEALADGETPPVKRLFQPELVIRESTSLFPRYL